MVMVFTIAETCRYKINTWNQTATAHVNPQTGNFRRLIAWRWAVGCGGPAQLAKIDTLLLGFLDISQLGTCLVIAWWLQPKANHRFMHMAHDVLFCWLIFSLGTLGWFPRSDWKKDSVPAQSEHQRRSKH